MKRPFCVSRFDKALAALSAGLIMLAAASCSEPLPLYGTWADNKGNNISFFEDSSFVAVVVSPETKEKMAHEGTWTMLLNSLTLSAPSSSLQVVTEWDIRGNMLYLDWATETSTIALTLYKVSN
jgi:hypothetical protein